MSKESNGGCGCSIPFGLGGVLAAVISYALNGSFWWAVLAFIFNWFYVLNVVFFRTKEILPALKAMIGA